MHRSLLVVAALALLPAASHAQVSASTAPTALAVSARTSTVAASPGAPASAAVAQLQAQLRNLVAAQERYYADHGTYTTDAVALGVYKPGQRDSVVAQVIFAGGRGWTGTASHLGLRGKSCVIFIGRAAELPKMPETLADGRVPDREGAAVCDQQ